MKKRCSIFFTLCSSLLLAQQPGTIETITENSNLSFVKICDTNSIVVTLTMEMDTPESKLPRAIITKEGTSYRFKSKVRNVTFSFKKEHNNKIIVWVNETEKHCFTIDSSYHYSFQGYSLSDEVLEVHGKIKWGKFYRKFRIIFYTQVKHVLFDFDDGIFKQK